MNISHKHKTIWWAPEKTGSTVTSHILKNYDFFYYEKYPNSEQKRLCDPYHSHDIIFPNEYSDYEVICSMRNPYDRVLSIFINFAKLNLVYTKDNIEYYRKRFEIFIKEMFLSPNLTQNIPYDPAAPNLGKFLKKVNFSDKVPDVFIKMENLENDLKSLNFIKNTDLWEKSDFSGFLGENEFIKKRPFYFSDVYTKVSAKYVYEYFKNHFYLCDYDPFSFTKSILTDEEKKKFLHDTL
jgi:hypothetical protein